MLKYLKRKHPIDEEDQEGENDSQPSTSKEELSDKKKIGVIMRVIWPLDSHGRGTKTVLFHYV